MKIGFYFLFVVIYSTKCHFFFEDGKRFSLESADLKVPIEKFQKKSFTEFIEDGKIFLSNIKNIREKAIMVLGLTGTGKSTLVNYLNGIPLVCIEKKGKWIIDFKYNNATLEGAFKIGHGTSSETKYPSAFSPTKKDFSFIDNPGFRDTRGLGIHISNGYFRKEITKKVKELKFILLLAHESLNLRGYQFRESIKGLSEFLGIFDAEKDMSKSISNSMCIIITRVDSVNKTDDEMKNIFKEKLIEILDEEKETNNLSENEDIIFRHIITNNQIEIFSNPRKITEIDKKQSQNILSLIDKLDYMSKDDLKLKLLIERTYIPQLILFTQDFNSKFKRNFTELLRMSIDLNFKGKIGNDDDEVKELVDAYSELEDLRKSGNKKEKIETFLNQINEKIINKTERETLFNKKDFAYFLTSLISFEDKNSILLDHFWIDNDLENYILNLLNEIKQNLIQKVRRIQQDTFSKIEYSLISYFKKNIDQIENKINITHAPLIYSQIIENQVLLNQNINLEQIILSNNLLIDPKLKDQFLEINKDYIRFNKLLSEKEEKNFDDKKIWKTNALEKNLTTFRNILLQYLNDSHKNYMHSTYNNGVFVFKGFSLEMSSILRFLNTQKEIRNLTNVKIFSLDSFLFDVDYIIKPERYFTKSPDLLIISPKILIPKLVNVDLSCYHVPNYPDNQMKAKLVFSDGEDGINGKPGLPGYNGGNLFILADQILNYTNLNFISDGGIGGPGQDGGDGINGSNGRDALFSDIETQKCKAKITFNGTHEKNCSNWTNIEYLYHVNTTDDQIVSYFRINGSSGGKGGKPGLGGDFGIGGYGGKSTFIYRNNKSLTSQTKIGRNGLNGISGKTGMRGLDGLDGGNVVIGQVFNFPKNFFGRLKNNLGQILKYPWYDVKYSKIENNTSNRSEIKYQSEFKKNSLNKSYPINQSISNIYEDETNYLDFSFSQVTNSKNNELTNENFYISVIEESFFKPDIEMLLKRLQIIEKYQKLNLLPYIQKELYSLKINNSFSNEENFVLDYMDATIKTINYRHESNQETVLVIDCIKYLEIILNDIKNLNAFKQKTMQNVLKENIENNLKMKIDESNSFINELQNDIKNYDHALNEKIRTTLNYLKNIAKKQSKTSKDQKIQAKIRLLLNQKSLFKVLNLACYFMIFLGPKGTLAATVILSSSLMAQNLLHDQIKSDLSVDINKLIENFEKYLNETESKNNKINLQITNYTEFEQNQNFKSKNKNKILIRKKQIVENVAEIFSDLGTDLFNSFSSNDQKQDEILEGNKTNYQSNLELQVINNKANTFQSNIIKYYLNSMKETAENLKTRSHSNILITVYKIKSMLNELKGNLLILVNKLQKQSNILSILNRFEFVIDLIISLYTSIQNYEQQNELVNFISSLHNSEKNLDISPEYEYDLNYLNIIIKENFISERYQQAVNAFKYWSFPFYQELVAQFNISEIKHLNDAQKTNGNLNYLIHLYSQNIVLMKKLIDNYDSTIIPSRDNHLQSFSFSKSNAFFKWSSIEFPLEMKQLFSGNKTTFYADIKQANYDAIKFQNLFIEFELKSKNLSMTQKFTEIFNDFFVELTHSGVSFYKFKEKIFKMNLKLNEESKLKLKYLYGHQNDIKNSNEVLKKLSKSNALLSPYTFWEIQLVPIKGKEDILTMFNSFLSENEMMLYLCGEGQYYIK